MIRVPQMEPTRAETPPGAADIISWLHLGMVAMRLRVKDTR
jgi:hypothetical protein